RALADRRDAPERLVARDQRERHAQGPVELLDVAAADAAGLDAQQRLVGPDRRERQPALLEAPRRRLHHRERGGGAHGSNRLGAAASPGVIRPLRPIASAAANASRPSRSGGRFASARRPSARRTSTMPRVGAPSRSYTTV